ncbi:MAG: tRNA (adenosine(37)-N6)-threonylcarbamoyltransferase complex transferase subunit TsaD, partial [Anaerolineae bacterium]|nr:tRNA (adenosine(37)-N6)-threonylcarbamoyltransferase complex transferase subunit TsaD [Anaerolineae bacterium]
NASAFDFPRARLESPYDFSFSGLKTAVLREVTVPPPPNQRGERLGDKQPPLRSDIAIIDVAASFQKALVDALVEKTTHAAKAYGVTEILLAGGVSANQLLRREMRARSELPVRFPPLSLCTDNAAMIAAAAHYRYLAGLRSDLDMDVRATWALTSDAYDK